MATPTLAFWNGRGLTQVEANRRRFEVAVEAHRSAAIDRARQAGTAEVSLLKDVDNAREELRGAMIRRWKEQQVKRDGNTRSSGIGDNWGKATSPPPISGGTLTPDRALPAEARRVAASLKGAYMPVTKGGRARRLDQEKAQAERLLEGLLSAEGRALDALYAAIAASLRRDSGSTEARELQAARDCALPDGIGEGLRRSTAALVPGDGRFILQSGWIRVDPPVFEVGSHKVVVGPTVDVPALLDLDDEGGLITDSSATVNLLIRRMLAMLPAGQLQLKVFDPKKLGRSVRDLFQVDAISSKVIPDKVFTDPKELETLLEKLEIHLTDVTRKYLGAKHRTLHEYNLSAGEVAEPYRILAIFDFPAGWDRGDGRIDPGLSARLAKIIEAGPTCGVFTLIHNPDPTELGGFKLPWLMSDRWDAQFTAHSPVRAQWPSESGGGIPQQGTQASAIRSSGTTVAVRWTQRVSWRAPSKTDVEAGATKALAQRLAADIVKAAAVSVGLSKVTALARAKADEHARAGIAGGPLAADPRDPKSWWKSSADGQLVARFGRLGATDVAEFRLDRGVGRGTGPAWLIGGVPGSGKSVLLHAIILDVCINYAPDQVQLWLADLKHGVEFKPYAEGRLPHAKVVGLQAGREFGIDMLRHIEEEQKRRGDEFRRLGVQRLSDYPRSASDPMPMIVAIIDEFQGLFEEDDRLGREAALLLDHIIKQGPAFGVHLVLASQQISGVALPPQVLRLIACRIALQSSESDSQIILGSDSNNEAADLTRAGEGILNTAMNGARDANLRFQTTHVKRGEIVAIVGRLRKMADSRNFVNSPVVMDASAKVRMGRQDGAKLRAAAKGLTMTIPLGRPLGMGDTVSLVLDREPDANVLLIAEASLAAPIIGQVAAASLMGGVQVVILDFAGLGRDLSMALDPISAEVARRSSCPLRFARSRDLAAVLAQYRATVDKRQQNSDFRSAPEVLVLANVNRAGRLEASAQDDLEHLVRVGPEVGIHVVIHADTPALLGRFDVSRRDFAVRIVGDVGPSDSDSLTESTLASGLEPGRAVLAQPRLGQATTVRLFQLPPVSAWERMT